MKVINIFILSLLLGLFSIDTVLSQTVDSTTIIKQSKSARQRSAAGEIRRNHTFSDLGKDYTDFKNWLNKEYGFNYSIDLSYMPQYGAPNGKQTAFQTILYPSFTWTNFNNEYG